MSANCNDQNQAFGMSVLAASFGIGLVVGPAVSGAIADPIGQYNLNITSMLIIIQNNYAIYNSMLLN